MFLRFVEKGHVRHKPNHDQQLHAQGRVRRGGHTASRTRVREPAGLHTVGGGDRTPNPSSVSYLSALADVIPGPTSYQTRLLGLTGFYGQGGSGRGFESNRLRSCSEVDHGQLPCLLHLLQEVHWGADLLDWSFASG